MVRRTEVTVVSVGRPSPEHMRGLMALLVKEAIRRGMIEGPAEQSAESTAAARCGLNDGLGLNRRETEIRDRGPGSAADRGC